MTSVSRWHRVAFSQPETSVKKCDQAPIRRAPREALDLPVPAAERRLIDRAAKEDLLDRTVIVVSPVAYTKFLALLDAPPQPNERLRHTMKATPPWERD
jgi:uncharacterized protein (DUF1778 family)